MGPLVRDPGDLSSLSAEQSVELGLVEERPIDGSSEAGPNHASVSLGEVVIHAWASGEPGLGLKVASNSIPDLPA